MNNRIKYVLGLPALACMTLFATANAAVPAEIDGMMTDATTLWGDVKEFVIGVVIFFTLLAIAKRVRRK